MTWCHLAYDASGPQNLIWGPGSLVLQSYAYLELPIPRLGSSNNGGHFCKSPPTHTHTHTHTHLSLAISTNSELFQFQRTLMTFCGCVRYLRGDVRELAGGSVDVFDQRVQRGARPAVGETVILLHPPSTFSRCFNRDGEGMSVK